MPRCFLFLLLTASVFAQLANRPPVPQWLAAPEAGATFTQTVKHEGKLLKAVLLTAGDAAVEIVLDDKSIATLKATHIATGTDLTRLLGDGKAHQLGLRVPGKAKAAALLELNGDLAAVRWIVTDASWQNAVVAGATDADPAANPFDLKKTFDAYNSWQLAKPGAQNQATDPATLTLPPGFKAELIRSAQPGEDSWVAMAFDPQGRITLGKEKKGLLRMTLSGSGEQKVEVIDDELLECRGLLYAHGSLFANANVSKTLFRLTDTNGDGTFDERKELVRTEGGVGHGRNHIKLGPDGDIYVAHGNNVLLPKNLDPDSPLKNYAHDQLIPNPWDGSMFDGNVELPAGHILRVKPDGSKVTLLAGGLRNPLDIAFNHKGELFTFDADMERDVGTPWYMPTRVLKIVPGGDYGWRRGTGRFPGGYMDTMRGMINIGLASPTGIYFGYGAKFPARYQDALFLLDWSYGRIIAVHWSKSGPQNVTVDQVVQDNFISGRPLNVTDGCIGPDGAMWFITGGRGTQSGLYRVTYTGDDIQKAEPMKENLFIEGFARDTKRLNELMRKPVEPERDLDFIWRNLYGWSTPAENLFLARVALERIPAAQWRQRALSENEKDATMAALLALARVGTSEDLSPILQRVMVFSQNEPLSWSALRVISVACSRFGRPGDEDQRRLLNHAERFYPVYGNKEDILYQDPTFLNRELCRLLVYLKSPTVIEKTMPLLKAATTSEDLLYYPFMLRYLKEGWTLEQRRIVFEALNKAEKMNGASTFFKAISDTRSELAAALKPEEAVQLAAVISPSKPAVLSAHALPGHSFKNWTLEDLAPLLAKMNAKTRNRDSGKDALIRAQCVFCHKVSNDPTLPAGVFGPDLVQVSARFNRRDLLDHILNPSKFIDEKFRYVTVKTSDGKTITGSLESEDDERVVLRQNPLAPEKSEIAKAMIKERSVSEISPMPAGLLNSLKAEQILDLLAWFETMR
ncbi:MAG: Cytochrome c [Prosthecobacter sp.]|nr:Cytochrome c [Prosthecobacter sp.]